MHRGKTADALLPQIVAEQDSDVAIISEQYSRKMTGCWIEDDTGTAAIWTPRNLGSRLKSQGKGNCFVWAQFEDVTVLSCYLTPSDNISEFETKLENIEDKIKEIGGHFIVAGDLNSRAVEWGMPTTNSRGKRIMDMAARTGLIVANEGNTPTFRRPGCEGTIPDITLVSEGIAGKILDWKVLEIYTGSDHQYISYSMELKTRQGMKEKITNTHKWKAGKLDRNVLIEAVDERLGQVEINGDATTMVKRVMDIIRYACNKAMPKLSNLKTQRKAVYWWNDNISELRRSCLKCRRKYTRAMRRGTADSERIAYKQARKKLRTAIFDSKRKMWEELRSEINENPYGLGYKIVMGKLGSRKPTGLMTEEVMKTIVETLFPTHDIETRRTRIGGNEAPPFELEEIQCAAKKLKGGKAPGPDGIPAEVIKEIVLKRPEILLQMYNRCLLEGVFPEQWKRQFLVLIGKGNGDTTSASAYRPLCLLDTAGKLLEAMIKPRIQEAIRAKGGLSDRQHGFRPSRSTIGALKDVTEVVEKAMEETHHSRPVILLATLDVKNAFNSLRWKDVLHTLEYNFAVPPYLMQIIEDYLKNRVLRYNTREGIREHIVTSGAAQGSILGPDLWNVSYDEILKIEMPADTFLVGYADDIAAVIKARDTNEAQMKLRQVMIRTRTWLKDHGLELATQKTELLLLTRCHIPLEVDMQVDDVTMKTQRSIKYLGVRLDSKLTYSVQINYAATKAAQIITQLSKLMANIGGPLPKKRKLLMEASNSILLYGAEIWADTLKVKQRANQLLSVQRRSALRVTSAYRTVSEAAVMVIAGMVPIDIQAEERKKIYEIKTNNSDEQTIEEVTAEKILKWQERWNSSTKGRWTARLIPDIEPWLSQTCGEVNYYMTQILSGHGYFKKYLFKIGKSPTPFCLYEESEEIDDAEHTFFTCTRWENERQCMVNITGCVTVENLINKMTTNAENWRAVANFCERILRAKKLDLDADTGEGENTRLLEANE